MRVCDYIAQRLYTAGIRQIYGMVGGGTAGLNDGWYNHHGLEFVSFHHEQGAGHAAVAAARTNQNLSVVNVTTGCGGTNALTSCLNAWQESAPVLFLSGNTKITNMASYINKQKNINLRRYGLQEHDIVTTVANMTKYAVLIQSVDDVAYELDKAIDLALSGRMGPVWIDIPGNIQSAEMPEIIARYEPFAESTELNLAGADIVLQNSTRPVAIAGAGLRWAGAIDAFKAFVEAHNIPFVTTFLTKDIIATDHPLNIGMIGIKGNRAANFAMQNADCLLILGSSMNVSHIGYDASTFSPASQRIQVDIDASELMKGTFRIDYPIVGSVADFLAQIKINADWESWAFKCFNWKRKWPLYDETIHRPDTGGVNLYEVVESLNRNMYPGDALIVDAGQPCYVCSTNGKFKTGQRYWAQAAQGDMGYAIPALVGIYKTDHNLNPIACIGEGSFMTNIQELATIAHHRIPAKIIVINNDGYMSIKQTQSKFFNNHQFGVSQHTGVNFPSIENLARAFNIDYELVSNNHDLDRIMASTLHEPISLIIEVKSQTELDVLPAQAIKPDGTQGSLHDMAPFLSAEELKAEMLI